MTNRLKAQASPYLRQHSENPVDWYPWCEEAFEKARREDKPVFLSIGYSSCHWCHVMAKESFENPELAKILNSCFVSVKVDREERSDIDSVYMEVCTAFTGSGGWPLTIIMSPSQEPFFAGTYIPLENSCGRMGLKSLLLAVNEMWRHRRSELLKSSSQLMRFMSAPLKTPSSEPSMDFLLSGVKQLYDSYDSEYGGFGSGTKFPAPHNLIFLLRYSKLSGDKKAREIAEHSLQQMYRGGIYDHIGGGFCRYSTDREWLVPHFEKTLYDNALLAYTYTEAYEEGRLGLYKTVAEATLNYCLRELRSPEGAFYCSQDADSQGVEGRYYLLSPEDVSSVLGPVEGKHFCECYDILPEGNFKGKSIPNLLINQRWRLLPEGYDEYRERLLEFRRQRAELFRDEKLLSSWNGLMLMALSKAARVFNSSRYLAAAQELGAWLLKRQAEGLISCSYQGQGSLEGNLNDLSFCALGLLELYRVSFEPGLLIKAAELGDKILSGFSAPDGSFYLSSDRAEKLIKRPRELFDGAMPSGNSACALLFDSLGRLSGDIKWTQALDRLLKAVCSGSERYPAGCSFALCALLSRLYPTRELLCAAEELPEALEAVMAKYAPELSLLLKTAENAEELSAFAPYTADIAISPGKASFYLCSGGKCGLPFTI